MNCFGKKNKLGCRNKGSQKAPVVIFIFYKKKKNPSVIFIPERKVERQHPLLIP